MSAALRHASGEFTLLVEDQGARLLDEAGQVLAQLPEVAEGSSPRQAWGDYLKEILPPKAKVQLLLAHGGMRINCQEVPYLSPREQREVAARLAATESQGEPWNGAHVLDVDPHAEGGHQLWTVGHPDWEMKGWVAALATADAELVFATAWHRAFAASLPGETPATLCLAVEQGMGHLLFFRGRGLVHMRAFRLPGGLDLETLPDEDAELLCEAVLEETGRLVQFIKQKHRGLVLDSLRLVGLPQVPAPLLERLERSLRLAVKVQAPSLPAFLLQGLARERGRAGSLNLVPLEIQDALKLRILRVTAWVAAIGMVALLGVVHVFLSLSEANFRQAAEQAERARDERVALAQEAAKATRLRFGFLRLKEAERVQKESLEHLEGLGLALFQVPEGVTLVRVDVIQAPEDGLHHFTVEGTAVTRKHFSVGPLADYLARLQAFPGMKLDPLRDVSVSDRFSTDKALLAEQAITRFKLTGVAP